MSLQGKVALITGSTSGIGLGVAQALAGAGADVMLNGFGDAAAIAQIQAELAGSGVRVGYNGADLSQPTSIAGLIEHTKAEFGRLDVLVNNAGIQHTAPIESFPDEQWDRVIAINLSAAFHTTKAAIPHLKQAGWGRIINIASAHGLVASPQKAAYVAAKHGVVGLTKVTALELANSGTTANAICPGWVLTPLVQRQIETRALSEGISSDEMAKRFLEEKQAMLQFTTPEGIGGLAVFLCSDAARTITGACLSIDGGWVAQ